MTRVAVFAGSFDPFTIGHYDIVSRASLYFDRIFLGVADNSTGKKCFLDLEKRIEITKLSVSDLKNVDVLPFEGFLVDFAKSVGASCIIRGMRTSNDFEYEKTLGEVYRSQNKDIEIFHLISLHNYCHISSTIVRELAFLGGDTNGYTHPKANKLINELYSKK